MACVRQAPHCHAGAVPQNRDPQSTGSACTLPNRATDTTAKLMLVALSFAWGLTWPAMRIALDEIPPFSMRV